MLRIGDQWGGFVDGWESVFGGVGRRERGGIFVS